MTAEIGPLAAALAKAQTSFPTVAKDKKVTVQTKTGGSYSFNYAPLDSILNAVRKPLADNGLVIVQLLDDGALVTSLIHDSGALLSGRVDLPNGSDIQAFGSAITYLRRYAIQAMLGIAAEDDDDGNRHAGTRATVSPRRAEEPSRPVQPEPNGDRPPAQGAAEQRTTHRDGLIGKAIAQGTQDFQLRQGPDGPVLPFRIKEGRLSQIAVASGDIAQALDTFREAVIGQRVTVWGHYTDESYPKKDKDGEVVDITYKVLHVERIATPDWILPAPVTDTPLVENLGAGSGNNEAEDIEARHGFLAVVAEPDEAPPIWEPLDEEERALIAGSLP